MSTTEVRTDLSATADVARVDMKLEVVVIAVSDVDRAKEFYMNLGWRLDADIVGPDGSHAVQLTPPGSGCSIQFGTGWPAPPGSAQGLHLIVSDIEAARAYLVAHGADVNEVYHCESGYACRFPGQSGRVSGRHPEQATYGSFLNFTDPDGNGWILQEITARFPGRVDGDTTYSSASDLSQALRRAAAAHGTQEAGTADPGWADRYAEYMVHEQTGGELPA